ncbi:VOC family protein [Shewanella inventionis]|uniref:VOC family protein n=1 Tax=Shewanella inventionis TaxID=1738770 RepID=A0ABQ1JS25_9GAMM|nr:VOC family protein [Shewanella inventionis]MCL1159429.1 VOC family protein [Shewanella inventionis]UAL41461.1 VOC family protein [Shewanella inventionis]GGB73320.1 VOC family protein [Shewanella inventionis]
MNYQQLQHTWADFSLQINAFIEQLGLDHLCLQADHAALRVNHHQTAQLLADEFSQHGDIISNNMINGRPILIIKLTKPLIMGKMQIDCVELPFPSDKTYPVEGWEHIELVFPSQAQTCEALVAELIEQVPQLASIIDNAHAGIGEINIKLSSPKGDNERLANPTIAFKTKGICVKVHPHDIQTIIASEQ